MEDSANGNDISIPDPAIMLAPRPISELDAAALKLQKGYKSHRTRTQLADCAVKAEARWWKLLDFAELKMSSVSFFNDEKPETARSKWARVRIRMDRVVKVLSKDENDTKLELHHWLEAIDPGHRNGRSLRLYYEVWFRSESVEPFFYWLDFGEGKEVNLDCCTKTSLNASRRI